MEKSIFQLAFNQIQELINHFEAGIEHYLSPNYQEAEVRKEYIDKFYTCLGWDVNHDFQKNPFEQEVKIEKAQRLPKKTVASLTKIWAFGYFLSNKNNKFC